jgi:hypothetical protein
VFNKSSDKFEEITFSIFFSPTDINDSSTGIILFSVQQLIFFYFHLYNLYHTNYFLASQSHSILLFFFRFVMKFAQENVIMK